MASRYCEKSKAIRHRLSQDCRRATRWVRDRNQSIVSRVYSLTAEVRKPGSRVAVFMRDRFPHLAETQADFKAQVAHLPTLRPDRTAGAPPYATIGAAVDYRLRYYFRKSIVQTMDAFRGAQYLHGPPESALREHVTVPMYGPEIAKTIKSTVGMPKIASDFFDRLDALATAMNPPRRVLKPQDELLLSRYCYILALFEQEVRSVSQGRRTESPLSGLKNGATVDDLLAFPLDAWVKDIGRMAWLFGKRHSNLFYATVKVNPAHLSSVGGFGADADLLVNGYIIDIKATLNPVLEPAWLYQVLGYTLLDQGNKKDIRGVGFYLARQGVFVRWPLEPLIARITGSSDVTVQRLRGDFWNLLMNYQKSS
jgi:hypothetical protein